MTFLDAAVEVLTRSNRPMTAAEISREAVRMGLIAPGGKTPDATMSSVLYMHIKEGGTRVRRVFEAGEHRAVRGSVYWALP